MAKQGQHKRDDNDPRVSKGHNNPDESVTITTGSYKKRQTTREQAARGEHEQGPAQADRNEWQPDTREQGSASDDTRAARPRSGRSGSQSNASSGSRGS